MQKGQKGGIKDAEMAFDRGIDTAVAFACRSVFSYLFERISLARTAQDAFGDA